MDEEDEDDGVQLERRAGEPDAAGQCVEHPAAPRPPGHGGVDAERRRDRRALEVARLAARVARDPAAAHRRRHVEPRQPRQPAQHEHREQHRVHRRPQPDAEGHAGRC